MAYRTEIYDFVPPTNGIDLEALDMWWVYDKRSKGRTAIRIERNIYTDQYEEANSNGIVCNEVVYMILMDYDNDTELGRIRIA